MRVLQALSWVRVQLTGDVKPFAALRVPIDQYEANLDWIGRRFEGRGTEVLLITAPTTHARFGVPRELVEQARFGPDGATIVARHRAYNQRLRDLAARRGWHLLDLERELDRHPQLETLFWSDGIHFSAQGQAYTARLLSAYVAEHILTRR
jgi:lysophospholipase L1-like esterase